MLSAGPPEGGFVPKPPFHREHQDSRIRITNKYAAKIIRAKIGVHLKWARETRFLQNAFLLYYVYM
jgi:hypothetical protein